MSSDTSQIVIEQTALEIYNYHKNLGSSRNLLTKSDIFKAFNLNNSNAKEILERVEKLGVVFNKNKKSGLIIKDPNSLGKKSFFDQPYSSSLGKYGNSAQQYSKSEQNLIEADDSELYLTPIDLIAKLQERARASINYADNHAGKIKDYTVITGKIPIEKSIKF